MHMISSRLWEFGGQTKSFDLRFVRGSRAVLKLIRPRMCDYHKATARLDLLHRKERASHRGHHQCISALHRSGFLVLPSLPYAFPLPLPSTDDEDDDDMRVSSK